MKPWGRILFLDLGRVTGWASGDPSEQVRPESGILTLGKPGSDTTAQYGALLLWALNRFSGNLRPKMVCFEAPIAHLIKKQSGATKRMLLGYPAVIEAAAWASKVPMIREASISDIRRNLLGRGVGRGEDAKAVVQAHLRALGCEFEDGNAADSIAGWFYACTIADDHAGERVTPLFQPGL